MQADLTNISYFFIPFVFNKKLDYKPIINMLESSSVWELKHDKIIYMLKYVADKFESNNKQNCQCFHYILKEKERKPLGLGSKEEWFSTSAHLYQNEERPIRFQILDVQLYCFSTSVGIVTFRVRFEKDDPFWIANAQYYLKKSSRENFHLDSDTVETNMLALSQKLVSEITQISETNFFYYANPSTERANVLAYLEVGKKNDYKKELYYLRRCYSEGFIYSENDKLDEEEIYTTSKDIVWGISPEAAICLACPEMGRERFIHNTFIQNFNAQYLFMYVLLLHQKYALYMFLTRIGIGMYNNLETLEDYKHQLYEFETDYVFSCVTEVPQYQNLYERMRKAFSLKQMYEDVYEPLRSLGEVRREAEEAEKEKREKKQNNALLLLSILSFFSALVDSFDFIDSVGQWFTNGIGIQIAQCVCIFIIFFIGYLVVKNLYDATVEKKKNKEKR